MRDAKKTNPHAVHYTKYIFSIEIVELNSIRAIPDHGRVLGIILTTLSQTKELREPMPNLTRRLFGALVLAATAIAATASHAAEPLQEYKIGFQKTSLPVIAQQQKVIEKVLEPKGIKVKWVEFTAGPPLVEALNVGSVDVGWVGDAPPIFGQSAGSAIVYVAALPSNGKGEAIFVKPASRSSPWPI